jgi:hypothetical protein
MILNFNLVSIGIRDARVWGNFAILLPKSLPGNFHFVRLRQRSFVGQKIPRCRRHFKRASRFLWLFSYSLCLDPFFADRSTISVMSFIPYSFFAKWSHLKVKKRGDDYNALKNAVGLQILDQVIREYPKMKVHKETLILSRSPHHHFSIITMGSVFWVIRTQSTTSVLQLRLLLSTT